MNKLYSFKRLIKKYTVPFILERNVVKKRSEITAANYNAQGKFIEPTIVPENAEGALIPFPAKVIYQSGGRLTEKDRTLYSLDFNIPEKSKIIYKGDVYHVESYTPYEDFADFRVYTLKAVEGVGE
jgi:hypothetical protein